MALILNLETSTKNCSVAVGNEEGILSFREESSEQYIHSEKLHVFIQEAMQEAGCDFADLQAVAVGKGPGSYTGLRIGISSAKGFCYGLNLPLISVDGLQTLVSEFLDEHSLEENEVLIPMLDARRMEVYCATHNHRGERQSEIEALVIDENSFSDLKVEKIHLIGDGAEKCKEVLIDPRFVLHDLKYPSAQSLNVLGQQHFIQQQFEDVAYFEPFYLKDFVAGKPKKLL